MRIISFLLVYSFVTMICEAQTIVKGHVRSVDGSPVFAANVFLKSDMNSGTYSSLDGYFELGKADEHIGLDTIVVSFIGMQTMELPIEYDKLSESLLNIELIESQSSLEEVVVSTQSLSKHYAYTEMEMLEDVYLNPLSQGDPLKAIATSPSSTTTDESAEISLRGSEASRSVVFFNGVPIYEPVRSATLNTPGFFSIINPKLVHSQNVYPSNPPLTYGKSSAGLVEIESNESLEREELEFTVDLASLGMYASKAIKKETFAQAYANVKYSDLLVESQPNSFPFLRGFNSTEAGVNVRHYFSDKISINSFSYYIDENFRGTDQMFTYEGDSDVETNRFYTINNLNWLISDNASITLNSGISRQNKHFAFGNIENKTNLEDYYISVDATKYLGGLSVQLGVSYDLQKNRSAGYAPTYYYAVSPEAPSVYNDTKRELGLIEQYAFLDVNISEKIRLGGGIRFIVPSTNRNSHFSSQLTLRYRPNVQSTFVLGAGRYRNFRRPSVLNPNFAGLLSDQVSLDYEYDDGVNLLKAAVYHKKEEDEGSFFSANYTITNGLEFLWQRKFGKYWQLSVSNLFVDQKMHFDDATYDGDFDFDFFVKSFIQYNSPEVSVSLAYLARPGQLYTGIDGGALNSDIGVYQPLFEDEVLGSRLGDYYRWDLSISKLIPMNRKTMVIYLSVNNIFNTDNERTVIYSSDYLVQEYDMYSLRTIFAGLKLSLAH